MSAKRFIVVYRSGRSLYVSKPFDKIEEAREYINDPGGGICDEEKSVIIEAEYHEAGEYTAAHIELKYEDHT